MSGHAHDWHEMGRVFPFTDADRDPEYLSPHGGDVLGEDGTFTREGPTHPDIASKIAAPTFHVILQCQDPDCPDGPKAIIHVELHKAERDKLIEAYAAGRFDPDGQGSDRLLSQASLADLGLGRIQAMLGEGRISGAREVVI